MANDLILSNEFTVTRTSKAGKSTVRTALGVVTSGNAAERKVMGAEVVARMIECGNFRHVMREVQRVFPTSLLKKCPLVLVDGETLFYRREFVEDGAKKIELEQVGSWIEANKAAMLTMATIIERLALDASLAGKPLKGEKAMYAGFLQAFTESESARESARLTEEIRAAMAQNEASEA